MSTALDLGSVTLHIADPLSGFCNAYYPIYLNQQGKQPPLTISFSLTAVVNGVCSLIDPAEHDISIVPMLRYGHTPIAVPVPTYCSDIVLVVPNDPNTHAVNQLSTKLSFRISKDCLSDGGLESTVRLRLLAVHKQHNVVLSIADSQRFVIMTKEVPSGSNLVNKLRVWGFAIHPNDADSRRAFRTQGSHGKRPKLAEPCELNCEEAPSVCVVLPSGATMMTYQGRQKLLRETANPLRLT